MNKLLSILLTGVFAATLGVSAFAAEPTSSTDAVKSPTANSASMKHKQIHKVHKPQKAEKVEHAPATPIVTK